MLLVLPDVLLPEELVRLKAQARRAKYQDGQVTAGIRARAVKRNEQVRGDSPGLKAMQEMVLAALQRHAYFKGAALPTALRPPVFSRYRKGMAYGAHIDDAAMGGEGQRQRIDFVIELLLSDPGEYEGGESILDSAFGPQEVKLPAGSAICYPAGMLHEVLEVTGGERLAADCWGTSQVRDWQRREILHDLNVIRQHLQAESPASQATDLAFKTYANLLRRWSEI